MAPLHPYQRLPISSKVPVKLKLTPGKGWGVYATRRIARGDPILREQPIMVLPPPHEQRTEREIKREFKRLPRANKALFMLLRDTVVGGTMKEVVDHNSIDMHLPTLGTFTLSNIFPATTKGVFALLSRLRHSCVPNTFTTTNPDAIGCFASADIAAGDEITICNIKLLDCRTRSERHVALGFTCHCKACELESPLQELSDLRRRIIHGLQYFSAGFDPLTGQRRPSYLITDAKVMHKAANFSRGQSSLIASIFLLQFLLEQEGVLNEFMSESSSNLEPMIELLGSKCNRAIAKLALTKATRLEQLQVAWALYGRKDINDVLLTRAMIYKYGPA